MLALLVHLILIQVVPAKAELANSTASERRTARYQRDCERRFHQSKCTEFFAENPELVQFQIDCRAPIHPGTELYKFGEGGFNGAKDMWNLIRDIGASIWNGGPENTPQWKMRKAYLNSCAQVQECKLNLIRSVRADEISPEFEARIAQIPNGSVLEKLIDSQQRLNKSNRNEKVRELIRTMPAGAERDEKISEILPEWNRQQDQSDRSLWELGLAGADRLGKFGNCYNREVQMEAVGYGLSTLLIPGAVAKVGSKLGQVTNILARSSAAAAARAQALRVSWAERVAGHPIAGNAKLEKAVADAHASGAGVRGADGVSNTRFGNYTEAQLKEKLRILEAAGFSPKAAKDLVRRGVVGHDTATMKLVTRAEAEFDRIEQVAVHYAGDAAKSTEIKAIQAKLLEECIGKGVACKETFEAAQAIKEPFRVIPGGKQPASAVPQKFATVNPAVENQITKNFGPRVQEQIRAKLINLEEKAREAIATRRPGQTIAFNMGKPLTVPGMRELRLFEGEATRIYFAFDARSGRLDILGVGAKATQTADIEAAQIYFKSLQASRR